MLQLSSRVISSGGAGVVVVLPDDFPLCVPRSCAGLEVKELLLLLGVLPPLTTALSGGLWKLRPC